jgi:hypothetical protein
MSLIHSQEKEKSEKTGGFPSTHDLTGKASNVGIDRLALLLALGHNSGNVAIGDHLAFTRNTTINFALSQLYAVLKARTKSYSSRASAKGF